MTRARTAIAAAVAVCTMAAGSAFGQQPPPPRCLPMADVIAGLLAKHDEQPMWIGRAGNEALVIFANPDHGTWTALRLVGDALCPLSSGDRWSLRDILPGAPT